MPSRQLGVCGGEEGGGGGGGIYRLDQARLIGPLVNPVAETIGPSSKGAGQATSVSQGQGATKHLHLRCARASQCSVISAARERRYFGAASSHAA